MLEDWVESPRVLARIRRNYLARHIKELAIRLKEQGYSKWSAVRYLRAAEHFGRWLKEKGITPSEADRSHAKEFLLQFRPTICRPRLANPADRSSEHAGVRRLLDVMATGGDRRRNGAKTSFVQRHINEFTRHLRDCQGQAEATIVSKVRYVYGFLQHRFGGARVRLSTLRPRHIMSYVAAKACGLKPGTMHNLTSSLRGYFRFLQFRGHRAGSLIAAVPRVPRLWLASIPRVLSEFQIRNLVRCFDRATSSGRRDYAMTICMLDLGMRVSDVAALTLDDIDWRSATIHVANSKTRRPFDLPLPERVGRALADYLRHGRPPSDSRQVFVRHRAPYRTPVSTTLIRTTMRYAYRRAGLPSQWTGTHILRHTAATRMRRRGIALKDIADVLGHRSLDTTAIYAKVDLPTLSTVPLPWPEDRR
jgi:site-specific recombinase XerD